MQSPDKVEFFRMMTLCFPMNTAPGFASAGLFVAENHPIHPTRVLDTAVLLLGNTGVYPIVQDGREYLLQPGSFLVLFPHHTHGGIHPASEKQSHFWCHFTLPSHDKAEEMPTEMCILPEFGYLEQAEKFRLLFRQLIDASQTVYPQKQAGERICDAYCTILLQELSQAWIGQNQKAADSSSASRGIVEKVREYLRLHACRENIRIADLAAQYHYNAGYLSEIFHRETGMTIVAYLQHLRIEEAKRLLLTTDYHIDTIATLSGFGDAKYFMKVFKRTTNVTPTEYRYSYYHIHENNH